MILFLYAAALAAPSASPVEISDAVRSMVAEHKANLTIATAGPKLEALAENGDATAAALLGELYGLGALDERDHVKSCDFSERAGEHASALHNLATCYFSGNGRPKNLSEARSLYERAAELGLAKAYCAYGNMLIAGDGGSANVKRGLALCKQAADSGNPDAQTDYGGYLLTNQHIPKDAIEARRYLSLAAEQGQGNAAFLLGQIYWNGDGIDKNVPQAAIWWIKAYEAGRTDAALLIGNAAFGLIVDAAETKQPVATLVIDQSKKWLGIAAEKDPDPAKRGKAKEMLGLLDRLLAGSQAGA